MNKIFKLIWSNALNGWVVCSELGKKTKHSSAKTLLIGAIALTSSYSALAAECVSWAVNSGSCSISEQIKTTDIGWSSVLGIGKGSSAHVTVQKTDGNLGDLTINAVTNSPRYGRYDSSGISLVNASSLKANDITVNIKAGEVGKTISVFGLTAWGAQL